ncbi:sulfonate ABC transporter substrate-binding protein [Rhizocola hellebori]|uniref:Sulfonate ABC transporter substrate-binding protein n=1 Tax=Rhizocola hellebori TaxID=1392758 RepID=A0A8J3VL21_9ACTN|nr:ABC transporter substrate-binding protein [Rhizocola hellebori]GIH09596.1 sulfonate ABC transporter substrate-binding protein [Rhizocola hellebori]
MKRRVVGLLAVLSLAISGCGTAEEPEQAKAKVTLAFSAWPGWFPWQVAQEQGLFAKNGVEVELKYFDSYTDSLTALATGKVSANSQTLNDTLASVSGGAAQKIVLVNDNSTGNDQIIVAPGITGVADLKGKAIAVEQSTVDHYLLLLALQKAGLKESDITLKPLLTDAAAAAFAAGEVDAVGAFAPFTSDALKRPGSKVLTSSKDFPGAIPDHLVFTAEFVSAHPTEVQAVVRTWFDTIAWIQANKEAAIAIMAKKAGVSADEYKTYDAGTTIFTREQNLSAFASGSTPANLDYQAGLIAQFLVDTKLAEKKPSLDGLFEPKFVQAVSG